MFTKRFTAKSFTAGIVGSALLATAAFAQSPSTDSTTTPSTSPSPSTTTAPSATSTPPSSTASTNSSYTGNWRASKVVGLSVYNEGNESLGTINDLLTDKSGKIVAVVVGVGGFLGVGERYVAIPFEKVKFVNEPVATNTASSGSGAGGASSTKSSSSTGTTGAAGSGMSAAPAASTPNPWYPDHAVISGTKDQLKSMPEFKYTNS
ncbi:MAG: photosystem reaction center subunit [Tardiphaga sp.]|nr:photosystem reaction center subunit [Tardiphaga sp.]